MGKEKALELRRNNRDMTWREIADRVGANEHTVRRWGSEAGVNAPEVSHDSPERWLILGDMQVPFHSPPAIELASEITRLVQPDNLVYNGDNTDNWRISRHGTKGSELHRKDTVQDDFDMTIELQDRIARGAPKARRHNIDGNHEDTFDRYIGNRAPELNSLRALSVEEVMSYQKRGFASYHPWKAGIWIGDNLFVTHGDCAVKTPGASVQRTVMQVGESVVMNHVHRRAHVRFKLGARDVMGIENGCLCQFEPSYTQHVNWAHCLTVVTQHDNRHYTAEVVDMISDSRNNEMYAYWHGERVAVALDYDDGMALPWRAARGSEY